MKDEHTNTERDAGRFDRANAEDDLDLYEDETTHLDDVERARYWEAVAKARAERRRLR